MSLPEHAPPTGTPREDLDPRNAVLRGPDEVPVPLRVLFAAQHPFMYLVMFALCVALAALALAMAGAAVHGWVRLLLWAWRLA